MPGIIRDIDSVAGIATTTTKPVTNPQVAHLGGVYLVQVDDIVGRWNVVLEYTSDGRRIELARVAGIEGLGLFAMTLTPPLDRAPAPLIEPTSIRYFTASPPSENPRLAAKVTLIAVV